MRNPNKTGKGSFCTAGVCKCKVVFKLRIYKLQMFHRPSDIKCSFVSSNCCLISNYSNSRSVFRTQSNIYDGAFCAENAFSC